MNPIQWPPVYHLKKHHWARQVKLTICPAQGLKIVVPPRFNIKKVAGLLEENKLWIVEQLTKFSATLSNMIPTVIELTALKTSFKVIKKFAHGPVSLKANTLFNELVIAGDTNNAIACQEKIIQWIKKQARMVIASRLTFISEMTQLPYRTFTLRNQKTRWGSCSRQGNINLNYKLIFLPPELLDYVIIHELCHTRQFNHSAAFWTLVENFDPHWRHHKRLLRNSVMPDWLPQ